MKGCVKMPVYQLTAAYKDYIWGGHRLKDCYGKEFSGSRLAESWELSCHPDGPSLIKETGETLVQHLQKFPEETGWACRRLGEFPLLVKLIDAASDLSIQVHPDDDYAAAHGGQLGKTEMWYIAEAEPEAFIYYGVKEEITRQQLAKAMEEHQLCDLLRKVPVQKGETYFIPAGTIHAIGHGCVIAEVQQSSNLTYRLYDYDRLDASGKPRPLHIADGCAVADLRPVRPRSQEGHLGICDYFAADLVEVSEHWQNCADDSSFHGLLVLEGSLRVHDDSGRAVSAAKGDCLFISAGTGSYSVEGCGQLLLIYVPKPAFRVGVDLGGTNIKAGILGRNDRILNRLSRPTMAERPWQQVAADMAELVTELCSKQGISPRDCVRIGVGSPGSVDARTGTVLYSNNFPGWENVPLGQELSRLLGTPVFLSNDANCAALGEQIAGAAQDCSHMILLTLGTGVGGGVLLGGRIFEGGTPGGAELGHTTLVMDGELCTCRRRGCLEAYCSATALIREAWKAAQAHPEGLLFQLCHGTKEEMAGKLPFDAMDKGDPQAREVVENYIRCLGEGITNLVNIFRPQVVLLSGGVSAQGQRLTAPLEEYLGRYAFAGKHLNIPPIRCAALGNDAGIIGAAHLGTADVG